MFNIKNIVSKITERGKESQPNSPARIGQDDDQLSKQGAEGFLCPKCMMALPTPEELQAHYETSHDSVKNQNSPDASTSSSGAGFLGLHQEVGERYSRNRQDGNLISQEKLIAEVHGITEISELHKSLMDALESKNQLQLEKEQLEHKTAELAQVNKSLKSYTDEEQGKQTALKERLKIVEAQLAHRESIDDAAVLRQELVQVQRVMDKMTREREGERDDLQSERDELLSKVNELTEKLRFVTKSKNDDLHCHEELKDARARLAKEKDLEIAVLYKKMTDSLEQKNMEINELRSELLVVVSERDELNNRLAEVQRKEIEERAQKVVATSELEATRTGTISLCDQSDDNTGKSADAQGTLDKGELLEENEKTDLQKKIEELEIQLKAECQNSADNQKKVDALTCELVQTQHQLRSSNIEFMEVEIGRCNSHEALIEELLGNAKEKDLQIEKLLAEGKEKDLQVQKLLAEGKEKNLQVENINEENSKLKLNVEELNHFLVESTSNLCACRQELSESRTKLVNAEQSNFELHKSIAEAYLLIERLKDDTSVRIAELSSVNQDLETNVGMLQQEMTNSIYDHNNQLKEMKTAYENRMMELEHDKMSLAQKQSDNLEKNEELKKKLKEVKDKLQEKEKAVDQCKQEMENMELENKAALKELEMTAANDNLSQRKMINELEASLDEVTGLKLALEALLETSETEQKSLLEKFYHSCNDNESHRRTVDDVRRRLEDSQSALHELGRENQILQLELEKLLGRKWTEDADAAQCKVCSKEFSIIVRKHHCRNCGQIFCSDCSNKMAPLANNKKPVRVCDSCYNELASK